MLGLHPIILPSRCRGQFRRLKDAGIVPRPELAEVDLVNVAVIVRVEVIQVFRAPDLAVIRCPEHSEVYLSHYAVPRGIAEQAEQV
jgi:hypothetical protein